MLRLLTSDNRASEVQLAKTLFHLSVGVPSNRLCLANFPHGGGACSEAMHLLPALSLQAAVNYSLFHGMLVLQRLHHISYKEHSADSSRETDQQQYIRQLVGADADLGRFYLFK